MAKKKKAAKKKAKAKPAVTVHVVEVKSAYSWRGNEDWSRLKGVRVGDSTQDALKKLTAYFEKMEKKRGGATSWRSKQYRISPYSRTSAGKPIDPKKMGKADS